MCQCKVDQHLIALDLNSYSISKIIVTEFMTEYGTVSEDLNLMQKMWNPVKSLT